MLANETILKDLPDPGVVQERLAELTAERNLLRGLLRLFERQQFRAKEQRGRQVVDQRRRAGR